MKEKTLDWLHTVPNSVEEWLLSRQREHWTDLPLNFPVVGSPQWSRMWEVQDLSPDQDSQSVCTQVLPTVINKNRRFNTEGVLCMQMSSVCWIDVKPMSSVEQDLFNCFDEKLST